MDLSFRDQFPSFLKNDMAARYWACIVAGRVLIYDRQALRGRELAGTLSGYGFDMQGIIAVAFLVGCASNLLICEDMPAPPYRIAEMEACRAALPALIERHDRQESDLPVVMGKCRLMLRPAPSPLPEDTGVLAGSLR